MAGSHVDTHSAAADANNATVTAPDGIQDGDILVECCSGRGTGVTAITWPTDFTEVANYLYSNMLAGVAWKRASSESGNYQTTITNASTIRCVIGVFRGCYATDSPVDVFSNTEYIVSNTTCRAATVTLNYAGIFVASFFKQGASATTFSTPTNFTVEAAGSIADTSGVRRVMQAYRLGRAADEASGNVDSTITDETLTTGKHAILIGLRDQPPPAFMPRAILI